jgi:hypothetical protein
VSGPVKVAKLKKTASGKFLIQAVISGKYAPVDVVPPMIDMRAPFGRRRARDEPRARRKRRPPRSADYGSLRL